MRINNLVRSTFETVARSLLLFYLHTAGSGVDADYMLPQSDINIPRGQQQVTIPIPIVDDDIFEGNESFTLALSSTGQVVFTQDSTTVIITDNDGKSMNSDRIWEKGPICMFSKNNAISTSAYKCLALD